MRGAGGADDMQAASGPGREGGAGRAEHSVGSRYWGHSRTALRPGRARPRPEHSPNRWASARLRRVTLVNMADRATKALLLTRRRMLTGLALPGTTSQLRAIEQFDHPVAPRLARALERVRGRRAGTAEPWASRIEAERAKRLASTEPLSAPGTPAGPYDRGMTVRTACLASRRREDAIALHQMVAELRPERIIELGTNVGISSAYMAAAQKDATGGKGSLVTLEASPGRSRVARGLHTALGLDRVSYVLGLFEDTLESALDEPVDFAFIDGHHQYEPTLDYFDRIWRRSREGAVFIFDDIRWSIGMERAWARLKTDPRLSIVVDLCGLGVGIGTLEPRATRRLVTPILAV
jgi:predicted O-methyltransferase YrrM